MQCWHPFGRFLPPPPFWLQFEGALKTFGRFLSSVSAGFAVQIHAAIMVAAGMGPIRRGIVHDL